MLSRLIDLPRITTLRSRLTLLNAAVVIAMTVATLLVVRLTARATLYADADAELRAASREVALAIKAFGADDAAIVAEMQRKAESQEDRGWFMHLLTVDGTTIWTSEHCPNEVSSYPPTNLDRVENVVQVGHFRYVRTRVDRAGGPTLLVRVGTYTTGLDESLSALMRLLTLVGIVLSLIAPLVAHWLAGRATRPVATMLQTAERLSPTKLGDRLPIRGTSDELDRLALTINRLLDAVAEHVERQEHFVADAAHELRGPLAALQSSLEVAMDRKDVPPRQQESFADMLLATRHLSKVANDLLILAESASHMAAPHAGPVDVSAVARQAVAMFSGAAEEKGITLSLAAAPRAIAAGDPLDVRRLVSNLLDNAIRFTPAEGRVDVRVGEAPGTGDVTLAVADTGMGIARHDLGRVFDRFFKADPSRSHGVPARSGGLGLAICKSIVNAAGGSIGIESQPGKGTIVTVRLPPPRTPFAAGSEPLVARRVDHAAW